MKTLLNIPTGLNDCISTINNELRNCFLRDRNYNEIYFYSPVYDLSKYFDISKINCLTKESNVIESDYDFVINQRISHRTRSWMEEEYNVKNLIQIKKEILEKHEEYRDCIGIHLRVTYNKRNNQIIAKTFEDFLNRPRGLNQPKYSYIDRIEKIIKYNKKVCIFSDSDGIFDYLPVGENVIHEKPGCLNMELNENRDFFLEKTVHDIVKMGKCKELYITMGSFWNLAKTFVDKNLIVKKLENYSLENQPKKPKPYMQKTRWFN
jgi:hypothetical protein